MGYGSEPLKPPIASTGRPVASCTPAALFAPTAAATQVRRRVLLQQRDQRRVGRSGVEQAAEAALPTAEPAGAAGPGPGAESLPEARAGRTLLALPEALAALPKPWRPCPKPPAEPSPAATEAARDRRPGRRDRPGVRRRRGVHGVGRRAGEAGDERQAGDSGRRLPADGPPGQGQQQADRRGESREQDDGAQPGQPVRRSVEQHVGPDRGEEHDHGEHDAATRSGRGTASHPPTDADQSADRRREGHGVVRVDDPLGEAEDQPGDDEPRAPQQHLRPGARRCAGPGGPSTAGSRGRRAPPAAATRPDRPSPRSNSRTSPVGPHMPDWPWCLRRRRCRSRCRSAGRSRCSRRSARAREFVCEPPMYGRAEAGQSSTIATHQPPATSIAAPAPSTCRIRRRSGVGAASR